MRRKSSRRTVQPGPTEPEPDRSASRTGRADAHPLSIHSFSTAICPPRAISTRGETLKSSRKRGKTRPFARRKPFSNYSNCVITLRTGFPQRKAALSVNETSEQVGVICDSHPMWLDAVEQVLRRLAIRVVGKTPATSEALALVDDHRPDLLITELEGANGDLSGLALIERARASVPSLRPIVLSMHQDSQMIDAALVAGASAYVVKTAHPDDLTSAVRQAFSHSVYLAGRRNLAPAPAEPVVDAADEPGLTRRELEILRLMAEGHSNAQLARMLWVTEQTVKFHLSNIYRKLGVSNRTEAAQYAYRHDLVEPVPSSA
jgi:two-component system, NarL family, response regulator DevR